LSLKSNKNAKTVLVVSIKGGTGKTLIAANISYGLSDLGKRVAAIDADITSPNLAEMMGVREQLKTEQTKMYPAEISKTLEIFSMSLLANDKPISMEGLQTAQLLDDVIRQTQWGDVDYFIVDLPAGSSDQFKEVVKIFADQLVGSIIIVQPAHRIIAERCIKLHLDNGIPVVGLVENMSYIRDGKKKVNIFGKSIVEELATKYGLVNLGCIPLAIEIRDAVEQYNSRIPEDLLEPIQNAIKRVEEMKPQRPGFLQRLKEKTRDAVFEILAQVTLGTNKEINIPDMQKKYGYPGNRYIQLNIMDKGMGDMLASATYILREGKLLLVEEPDRLDTIIEIRIDSLAHIFMQDKTGVDGLPYDLQTAYYMGHARIWGVGETIRGLHFMREVWNTLRDEPKVTDKLKPLFKLFT